LAGSCSSVVLVRFVSQKKGSASALRIFASSSFWTICCLWPGDRLEIRVENVETKSSNEFGEISGEFGIGDGVGVVMGRLYPDFLRCIRPDELCRLVGSGQPIRPILLLDDDGLPVLVLDRLALPVEHHPLLCRPHPGPHGFQDFDPGNPHDVGDFLRGGLDAGRELRNLRVLREADVSAALPLRDPEVAALVEDELVELRPDTRHFGVVLPHDLVANLMPARAGWSGAHTYSSSLLAGFHIRMSPSR